MNPGLIRKALRETLVATLLFGAALALVEAILAYVLPTFGKQFESELLQIRFAQTIVKALIGADVAEGMGPEMFSAICWVHPVVLAIVWAHAIVFCTRVPAGEVDRGTVDVLLGLPVSRWEVFRAETIVCVGGGAVILTMALTGHALGAMRLSPELRPDLSRAAVVALNLLCVHLAVGALAWLVAALSDRRGPAMAVVFVAVISSFLVNYLAQVWAPAARLSFLSLLAYYKPLIVLRDGARPMHDMGILLGAAGALWLVAGTIFARRDLCTV